MKKTAGVQLYYTYTKLVAVSVVQTGSETVVQACRVTVSYTEWQRGGGGGGATATGLNTYTWSVVKKFLFISSYISHFASNTLLRDRHGT